MNEKLNVLGVDAWWMDATEPDPHSNLDIQTIKDRIGPTALGPVDPYFNTYALIHSGGVYEGARAARPDTRVFILTRSGFAGIQRYATVTWSGDITSTFQTLRHQIAVGRHPVDHPGRGHLFHRDRDVDDVAAGFGMGGGLLLAVPGGTAGGGRDDDYRDNDDRSFQACPSASAVLRL